jgi:predicted oxidoreductase (fatty acid repression mutant protein)
MKATLKLRHCIIIATLALTSFQVFGGYFSVITNDGPVGYWRLDEANTGPGKVATNYGTLGATLNGSYSGSNGIATVVAGCPGAIAGDSDTSCGFSTVTTRTNEIVVPFTTTAFGSKAFSFEVWAKPSSLTGGNYEAVLNCRVGSPQAGFILYLYNASWQYWMGQSTAWSTFYGPVNATTGWTHLVGTYDGTNQAFYVNGTVSKVAAEKYTVNTSAALQIGEGGSPTVPAYGFSTNIDEVAIYTNALTAAQVLNHYVTGAGANPPQVAAPSVQLFGPAYQTNYLGQSASMSVTAGGSMPFYYQWSYSATTNGPGTPVPNATNAAYTISSLALSNAGYYWVIITNTLGAYTSSSPACVQVINIQSPVITTQPQSEMLYAGATAHFICAAAGAGSSSMNYQWYYSNPANTITNLMAGQTNAVLALTNLQATNTGFYQVTASDAAGSNGSAVAQLVVITAPGAKSYASNILADGAVGYWRLGTVDVDDNATNYGGTSVGAYDLAGGFNGTYEGPITTGVAGAIVGDTDTSATFGAGNTEVAVPFVTNLNATPFTVELWAYDNGQDWNYYRSPLTSREDSSYAGYTFYATPLNGWAFWIGNGSTWIQLSGPAVQANTWTHLAATYDGANASFYVNGVLAQTAAVSFVPNTGNQLNIGSGLGGGTSYYWVGNLDEVALYDSALAAGRIAAHYALGVGQTVPPLITLQPYGGSVLLGSNLTLTVQATGSLPLNYQWQSSGTNLPGQTNSSLTLNDIVNTSALSYDVIVANAAGIVTSAVVEVTAVTLTETYSDLVLADGAVGYWPLNETSGTTANNLGTGGIADDGAYANGVILGQPGVGVQSPLSAEFVESATNEMEVNLPYDVNLNGAEFTVEAWARMTGPGLATDDGYQAVYASRDYHIYGGISLYGVYTGNWVLYTGDGSGWNILTGPSVQLGTWTHLACTYDGATVRFYVNGVLAASSTSAYIPNQTDAIQERIGAGDTESSPGAYFFVGNIDGVSVYNTALPAASIQAHYAVGTVGAYLPPTIVTAPAAQTVTQGQSAQFTVSATGTLPLSYQWMAGVVGSGIYTNLGNAGTISGVTATNLVIAGAALANGADYVVVVTNAYGSVTSAPPATLTVIPSGPLTVTNQLSGSSLTLSWPYGTLQQATNVNGPWTSLPGSNSPCVITISPSVSQMFYRAVYSH